MAVWAEGDGEDVALVTTERRAELFERAHVPEPDPSALAAGGQRVLVRAKDDGINFAWVRQASDELRVGAHGPEAHGSVLAAGRERLPIGTEGDATEIACVGAQGSRELQVRANVPQP